MIILITFIIVFLLIYYLSQRISTYIFSLWIFKHAISDTSFFGWIVLIVFHVLVFVFILLGYELILLRDLEFCLIKIASELLIFGWEACTIEDHALDEKKRESKA